MTKQRGIGSYDEWEGVDASVAGTQGHDGDSYDWATADDLVNSIIGAGGAPYQQETESAAPPNEPETRSKKELTPQTASDGFQAPSLQQTPQAGTPTLTGTKFGSGRSEYGAWSYQKGDGAGNGNPFGGNGTPGGRQESASEKNPVEMTTRRPDPHERRDLNGERPATAHFENGDKAGRKGRFTSILALVLAGVALVAAFSPVLLTAVDQDRWVIALLGSLPVTALCAVPALLLGLRSAVKPKEQLGKGRGIGAIVVCSVALAISAVLVVTEVKGMMNEMNMDGVIAKEQTGASSMTIVFPGGKLEMSNEAIKVLMKAGVLPDSTLDNGKIPISSQNGKVYVGSREIDTEVIRQYSSHVSAEASQQTLRELIDGLETLHEHNFAITTDGDSITLRSKNGKDEGYTITWDELAQKPMTGTTEAEADSPETQAQDQAQEQTQASESQLSETMVQSQQAELATGMLQAQPVSTSSE